MMYSKFGSTVSCQLVRDAESAECATQTVDEAFCFVVGSLYYWSVGVSVDDDQLVSSFIIMEEVDIDQLEGVAPGVGFLGGGLGCEGAIRLQC